MTLAISFGVFYPYSALPMCTFILTPCRARPETVESLFIAYRLTGDNKYREYGWNIFQAIEKYCKIESGGYASVLNVDEIPVKHEDRMETFYMVSVVQTSLNI